MLERLAVGFAVLALCAPAFGQRTSVTRAASASVSGGEQEMPEPADEDVGPDPDEEIPADLMGEEDGAAPSAQSVQAPPASAAQAPVFSTPAPSGRRGGDRPAPESKDAAVQRVAEDCHCERGLFCDAVRLDDFKTARCLLKYRDGVLDDCGRALDAAEPFLK
jgi:hypothetical protein